MSYARNGRDGDWVPTECGPRILPDTPDRVCTAGDGLPLPPSPNLKRDRRPTVGLGDGGEARGRTPGRGKAGYHHRRPRYSSRLNTAETTSIETMGMYTRTVSRSIRMSPGKRPNQASAPDQTSKPTITRATPATTIPSPTDAPGLTR